MPQFDEQLRLIYAEDELQAFTKAEITGLREEEMFINKKQKLVHWKFIAVSGLYSLNELSDGAEVFSRIIEHHDSQQYINHVKETSVLLRESCTDDYFTPINKPV